MDLNDGQLDDGPPAKRTRLALIQHGGLSANCQNSTGSGSGKSSVGVGIGCEARIEAPTQESKSWKDKVTAELRNHRVSNFIHAIYPTPDQSALRMINLVHYARKVETDMYESATSKEQYDLFFADKIYKIQKELENKRLNHILKAKTIAGG